MVSRYTSLYFNRVARIAPGPRQPERTGLTRASSASHPRAVAARAGVSPGRVPGRLWAPDVPRRAWPGRGIARGTLPLVIVRKARKLDAMRDRAIDNGPAVSQNVPDGARPPSPFPRPEGPPLPLEPYIDAHSHVWTPDVAHYPLAPGFKAADMQPRSFTAEELLAHCRPAGVGRVNLIQMCYLRLRQPLHAGHDQALPRPVRRDGDRRPPGGRPRRGDAGAVAEGRPGFRIQPHYSKQPAARWLEPAGYEAMFATAAQTGQALSCLIDPDGFPEVDRMCGRVPRDHASSSTTSAGSASTGTIRDADVEALCALAKHPHVSRQGRGVLRPGEEDAPLPRPRPADPAGRRGRSAPDAACGRATARSRSSSTSTPTASP